MKPDEQNNDASASNGNKSSNQAAAGIVRAKIDSIYDNNSDTSPYDRTHSEHSDPTADQWKQYHTAWQTYYQKYYEGYYNHHLSKIKQNAGYFANQPTAPVEPEKTEELTPEEAVFDLRQKLLGKVAESATKVRKSRHFIPIISGIIVLLICLFVQYNQLVISSIIAYISPGNIDPQNIIIDPKTDVVVSPEPRLIIPKINIDVPVIYDIGNDNASQMTAMRKGVAHFAIPGANSHPGEIGNTILAGHSSNDLFTVGEYKFVFVLLEKLNVGDSVYANYKSKRYTYTVTKKEVVAPNNIGSLTKPTSKPILTLLTCVPIGTATNRLLVTAEQINPDPVTSAPQPSNATNGASSEYIPGNQPTFFEWLFGKR